MFSTIKGAFSCLYGEIGFKRNIGNYMIKRFIPSFIIVVITFIGFWIPTTPARASIPITALLALITQQIQSDLSVSYVYALQVWNIMCIIFVFANLLEFSIALYDMHMDDKEKVKRLNSIVPLENGSVENNNVIVEMNIDDSEEARKKSLSASERYWCRLCTRMRQHFKTTSRHSRIDMISRYLFPVAFLLFVFIFSIWVSF